MATVAVFLALGGGIAWALERNSVKSKHIAPNAAKGADVLEESLSGIGSGFLGGEWRDLESTDVGGGNGRAPAGLSTEPGDIHSWLVPVDVTLTDFRALVFAPPGTGDDRVLELQAASPGGGVIGTLGCELSDLETACDSGDEELTIPAGTRIQGIDRVPITSGSPPTSTDAIFGYRVVTP
jgi:hypothetical protein